MRNGRSALIVTAQESFQAWLRALPEPIEIGRDKLAESSVVYLLPPIDIPEDLDELLEDFAEPILEHLLDFWGADPLARPDQHDLTTLREWFDLCWHESVVDLGDDDDLVDLDDLEDEDEDDDLFAELARAEVYEQVNLLVDKDAVQDAVVELFVATDQRDWPRVADCFAATVLFDLVPLTPAQITAQWDQSLRALDAVHHQIGNLLIDLDDAEATVTCHGIAFHYLASAAGEKTRTFFGTYVLHLVAEEDRWAVDQFRFDLKYMTGDPTLGQGTLG